MNGDRIGEVFGALKRCHTPFLSSVFMYRSVQFLRASTI